MTVAIAIAAATVFDALYMLFRRFDIDWWEGEIAPERWIAWGTNRAGYPGREAPQYNSRYFLLRLPSYQWVPDLCRDDWAWGQLTLLKIRGRWRAGYWIKR